MNMRRGEKWICSNPTCRSEFVVTVASGPEGGVNPRCCCGSNMKKEYVKPRFWSIQNLADSSAHDRKFLTKAR